MSADNDPSRIEPLLDALKGTGRMASEVSPSIATRLAIALVIALALLALVLKQAF
jgi:hypothetical protein